MNTSNHPKEKPILFSGPMVRAILDGRKTQTRRIVKPQPKFVQELTDGRFETSPDGGFDHSLGYITCPYGTVGDRLWVRETHVTGYPHNGDELQAYDENGNSLPVHVWYREDSTPNGYTSNQGSFIQCWYDDDGGHLDNIPWKPSIHMPRWASRITLEITGVRVERLQDISEDDAKAEGVTIKQDARIAAHVAEDTPARMEFWHLWQSINGPESWEQNPWVWVIEFRKPEANPTRKQEQELALCPAS